ncbi:MAG: hypothetical protein ACFB4I_22395 [Cyanophyceae cyanobacterium]
MPTCPRCHQRVDAQAVTCPTCKTPLKAFGHPGIPLHRAEKDTFLCDRCIYHLDDTCTFPQRPYAKTCTMYQDTPPTLETAPLANRSSLGRRLQRNQGLLLLLGLLAIAFLFTLL